MNFSIYRYLITKSQQTQMFVSESEASVMGRKLNDLTPLLRDKLEFYQYDGRGELLHKHQPWQRPEGGVWAGYVQGAKNVITHTPQYGTKDNKDCPPAWMIIDSRNQLIAIERNSAFASSEKAKDLLLNTLSSLLKDCGLEIKITPVTLPGSFWQKVRGQCLLGDQIRRVSIDLLSAKGQTIVAEDDSFARQMELLKMFTIPNALRQTLTWSAGRSKEGLSFLPENGLDEDTLGLVNLAIKNDIAIEVAFKSKQKICTRQPKVRKDGQKKETLHYVASMPSDMPLRDFLEGAKNSLDDNGERVHLLFAWLDGIHKEVTKYESSDGSSK